MKSQVEIEAKYDVAAGQQTPDLVGAAGVASVRTHPEMELTATYFDTADLALAAAKTTLRRRTGGTDDGWHLKLPLAGGDRLEVHRPIDDSTTPPDELTAVLTAILRGRALQPVATLVNRRTVTHLLDADGRVLAELADDAVTGTRHSDEDVTSWRELEVELVEGGREVLAGLDAAVRAAGIASAGGPSKVARVLGPLPPADASTPSTTSPPTSTPPALAAALTDLVAADPMVRIDREGGAARMLDAVRRVAAALDTTATDADPPSGDDSARSDLDRLAGLLAALVEADTGGHPAEVRRVALTGVQEELSAPRYLHLLQALHTP